VTNQADDDESVALLIHSAAAASAALAHYGRKRLFTRRVTSRLHRVYRNYKHYTVKSVNVW
jgi:hypothetical protein